MPGHAGNFLARLFGLSDNFLPLLPKTYLEHLVAKKLPVDPNFNKLAVYKFEQVNHRYKTWQDFHRSFADYLDWLQYRSLNLKSGLRYDFIYPIHPHEVADSYCPNEVGEENHLPSHTEFYYVELESQFSDWVSRQQKKLKFEWRKDEQQLFQDLKTRFNMQAISLSKMLNQRNDFESEYLRVCQLMQIQPQLSQAVALWQDWMQVRFYNQ